MVSCSVLTRSGCSLTGDQIAGREVEEEIGMVSAAAVRSKSVLSDMYVALAGLFGGASLCCY